jgi:hypothetical protein
VCFQKWSLNAQIAEISLQVWTSLTALTYTLSKETKKTQVNHSGGANAARTTKTTETNMLCDEIEQKLRKQLADIKVVATHLIENSRPPENPVGEASYYCARAFLIQELKKIITEETHK